MSRLPPAILQRLTKLWSPRVPVVRDKAKIEINEWARGLTRMTDFQLVLSLLVLTYAICFVATSGKRQQQPGDQLRANIERMKKDAPHKPLKGA